MIKNKIWVALLAASFLSSCSHMTPDRARKMPIIKVLHEGEVEKLALEKYVASVLAGEVNDSWPIESLKAQAIAARTFALLRMRERKNNNYHVQNAVQDQVLKKKPKEIFIKAARETAGLVLSINNRLAETSFHSTCGGKTTSSKNVWGRSYPHLIDHECGYCQSSPTYNWRVVLPIKEVEKRANQTISGISILKRTPDGRIDTLEITGDKTQKMSGHAFRMMLGAMRIKSTLINDFTIEGDNMVINGQGFGHGVGMCQYGARGMAKAGKDFKEILAHYYPGTTLKRIY